MNSKSVKCYLKKRENIEQAIIPICGTNMADKKFVGKLFSVNPCWVFWFYNKNAYFKISKNAK